ncbi:sulfurtransferase complex subunit TusB [Marinimicrobium sp. C6131]|uniref:sulfurtransferase complex subunit TusB n=1 Tax=Marinimicrobium sp. C6131 TaxID=3022676 RepID=UPI00223D3F50|nr:sulfurtransferase complex subunit TusB [Marinimicrobium sp. C6131]UZJ45513.1 sulfurtransferase complex subunit TusB [Marinimicrobium sp. C6131]
MSTLHTVNKSPFEHRTLRACIDVCQPGDAVLLLEDGVYGALPASPEASALTTLQARKIEVYALEADLRARGLIDRIAVGVSVADYATFVALSVAHNTIQSWY